MGISRLCGNEKVKYCKAYAELKYAVLLIPCRNECPVCKKKLKRSLDKLGLRILDRKTGAS